MSSKRNLRKKRCGNKNQLTKHEAIQLAKRLKMNPYKCSYCPHWHVGHPNGNKKLREAQRVEKIIQSLELR